MVGWIFFILANDSKYKLFRLCIMKKRVALIISPNYKDYAKKYLHDCAESLRNQDYEGEMKIFITDNETSQESFEFLSKTVPEAELILNSRNDGFAKGTNDSIRLALSQGYDYIATFSIHSVLEKSYISELVKKTESEDDVGVVQALMLMPDKKTINSLGDATHFLGFGYCLGYKENIDDIDDISKYKFMHYPAGASMFWKREVLVRIGLLDEEYWMYNEDQEIGWRIWLAGYKCILAPRAIMYTKYEFQRSIKKFYWMDRNRILAILECYHLVTLIMILPAFIVMEFGLILFSLKSGWIKDKLRVWKYFFSLRTWVYILRARKRNQSMRKVKDSEIVDMITGRIWYQEVDDWKLRFINPIFNLYWKAVKWLVKFLKL